MNCRDCFANAVVVCPLWASCVPKGIDKQRKTKLRLSRRLSACPRHVFNVYILTCFVNSTRWSLCAILNEYSYWRRVENDSKSEMRSNKCCSSFASRVFCFPSADVVVTFQVFLFSQINWSESSAYTHTRTHMVDCILLHRIIHTYKRACIQLFARMSLWSKQYNKGEKNNYVTCPFSRLSLFFVHNL